MTTRRVILIGANGFVGSAFARLLKSRHDVELICVTRDNFHSLPAMRADIAIEAAANSKKFLAEENPSGEFDASVMHCLKSLLKFSSDLRVHISSVDVYSDLASPEATQEAATIDLKRLSHYGFHKGLSEQLVQHYAGRWLILRLAGMVGPALRKNPVFDILNGRPLRIHPDSQYQYVLTDDVARIAWELVERNLSGEKFNICGNGLITMREIGRLAGRELNLSELPADSVPRIVEANNQKIQQLFPLPNTEATIRQFLSASREKAVR
ncbi:MAG TPA: NAD-dependent epimerase/dehydratase family protein [Verrucomicrobiae bacterium]|nr:NAD-dependent epimerase/dehydratase family protein [Verrucomicrobiae bacterium]